MNLKKEQKDRLIKIVTKTGILSVIAIAYAIFVHFTGWGIPCIFSLITKLQCPGCGITRMFLSLFKGDLMDAAKYNLLVLCLLPFFIVLICYKTFKYIVTGKWDMFFAEKIFYIIGFFLCVLFFILRNTDLVPFIRMP